MEAEQEWLQTEVYGSRRAKPAIEALDARTRYSRRAGRVVKPLSHDE